MAINVEIPINTVFNSQPGEEIKKYIIDQRDPNHCLYEHQVEALIAIHRQYNNPNAVSNIALVVLPTGCGKSGIAVLAPYVVQANNVLVITPSKTISNQLYNDFCGHDKMFLLKRGIIRAEHAGNYRPQGFVIHNSSQIKDNTSRHLLIANAHKFGSKSSVKLEDLVAEGINLQAHFDLVIVDEAHHYPAPTWKTIVDAFPNSKRLFLTATPSEYILNQFGACFVLEKPNAIANRIIRAMEFEDNYDVDPSDAEDIGDNQHKDGCVDAKALANKKMSLRIHSILNRHDLEDPSASHQAMVLTWSIKEAKEFAEIYRNICHDTRCESYTGPQTRIQRQIFKDFDAGRIRVLIVAGKLLEGFDKKTVSVVGIARKVQPTSKVLFTQFVGRAVRKLRPDDPITAVVVSHPIYEQRENWDGFDKMTEVDMIDEEPEEGHQIDEPMEY